MARTRTRTRTRPRLKVSKSPRSAAPSRSDGYQSGLNGRRISPAQAEVVAVLKPWLLQRFGTVAAIAAALKLGHASTVSQFLRCGARLPEARAEAWARRLGRSSEEREAILDLLALANLPPRVAEIWTGRQAAIRQAAGQLGSESG